MVEKNLTGPYDFLCITNHPENYEDPCIDTITPENELELDSWWTKLFLYKPGLLTGKILFLDLDVIIQNNIDALANHTDKFCGVYTKWNQIETDGTYEWTTLRWKKPFNSSVLTFHAEDYYWLWDRFAEAPNEYILKYYGEDKYLAGEIEDYETFPDGWIYSRLYGVDEETGYNDRARLSKWVGQNCYYFPDHLICILNGPTEEGHYHGNLERYWN